MRALLLLLALVALPARAGTTVDSVVAVVGNTPITASEVQFEEEMGVIVRGDECLNRFGRLLCDERAPLERLIFREALRQAGLTKDVRVSAATVGDRVQGFRRVFPVRSGADSFLTRWGLAEADLAERMLDLARLDQAIEVTVGRLVREVSEEEERRYHAENIDTIFGGRPYEEVAAMVSRQFYALKFERTYGAWASELRAAAQVRYVGR